MNIEEFIKATKAQIIYKDKEHKRKALKINVAAYPKEKQEELERYAYKHKDEIVRELFKRQPKIESHISLQEELHNFYLLKKQINEYNVNLLRYQTDRSVPFPVKPKINLAEEYGKLSVRAKAYLRADALAKSSSGRVRREAGIEAKQKISRLTNGKDSDYNNIIKEMEQKAEAVRSKK